MMIRTSVWISSLLSAILMVPPVGARTQPTVCGTERGNAQLTIARHGAAMRRLARERARLGRLAAEPRGWAQDFGQIAVMDSAGGVVMRQNPFSLSGRNIVFTPASTQALAYTLSVGEAVFDSDAAGRAAALTLDDDDYRQVDLPFDFPFFGQTHRQVLIHSDGNVTFGRPDAATSSRSLGRLVAGPPRIAPLFSDLNPAGGGKVSILAEASRALITWQEVPEFRDFGIGPRETVQLTLEPGGRITFAIVQAAPSSAVVGISPGNLQGSANVIDYGDPPLGELTSTVAEQFGNEDGLDMVRIAQRFYETHEDAYDYLVVLNGLGIGAASGALAFEVTVRNNNLGIGDTAVDNGNAYGSPYRLQAVMNMGPLTQYPKDPYQTVGARGRITGDTTMTLFGHEAGHLFLALASVRDPNDPNARPMLGTQLAHWSFNFNSEASLLEGNRISDLGGGSFLTTGTVEGYSALDQYLMGLRSPGEVPPTFLVANSNRAATSFPQVDVALRGSRRDIAIDEIIAAEGRRTPDDSVAQRLFRFAFILVVPEGGEPSPDDLAQVETYRTEFERYFHTASGDRAWAGANLQKMLRSSLWPAAGAVVNEDLPVKLTLARPRGGDLRVGLFASSFISGAESVVIPAGATSAEFTLRGTAAGVADVYFFADDPAFEVMHQKLDVKPSRSALQLVDYYREPGLLVLRVSDVNRLPYPNIPVRIEGSETPILSDRSGFIWLAWDGAQPLAAVIDGAPETRLVIPASSGQ